MKINCTFLFTVMISFHALADETQFDISSLELKRGKDKKSNEVCFIPDLSSQQLYIYRDIHKLHLADTEKMRLLLENQKKEYRRILEDRKIQTTGFADEIAGKYFRTKYNLSKNKTAFFHAVFYKVLLKDQRKYLKKCL